MNITLKLCVIALSSWICSGFLSGKLCSRNGLYQSAPPGIIQVASKRNWNDRYQQLVVFYEDHGHSDVGDGFDQSLTEWVYRQRKEYRKYQRGAPSTLTPAMIDLLNQLKFVWDKNQQAWDERFDELLEFQKEFGHVNVPTKYKTLGQWVTKQRKEQREGRLDDLRAKRLNGVSFVWNVKDWVFQARLEQLREFKNKHGHLKVKMSDGELGPWFYSRRKEYLQWLEGGKTTLSNEHREALEEVGFGPGLKKRRSTFDKTELSWDDRYDQLILFKRIHGHVRVPSSYGTLGSWVQYQRSRRDKMLAGRQRLLDQAGFVWSYREWQWDQRFEELVGYKKKFGNTDVPMSQGELGEWVQWQRVQHSLYMREKKSQLTARRVLKLNEVGFDWSRGGTQGIQRDLAWHRQLNELKKWKEENNHCNVPRNTTLGKWVASQRIQYRALLRGEKSAMTDKRRNELDDIGLLD